MSLSAFSRGLPCRSFSSHALWGLFSVSSVFDQFSIKSLLKLVGLPLNHPTNWVQVRDLLDFWAIRYRQDPSANPGHISISQRYWLRHLGIFSCVCVCVCVCTRAQRDANMWGFKYFFSLSLLLTHLLSLSVYIFVTLIPQCLYESQKTAYRNWFFSPTMWVLEI